MNTFYQSIISILWLALLLSCQAKTKDITREQPIKPPAKLQPIEQPVKIAVAQFLDTLTYNKMLRHMSQGDTTRRWPVKHDYPQAGAILPFKRVVAYYGNLYSKRMGILGELPKDSVLRRLREEVDKWTKADSVTPAVPALHYIAVTAQESPGKTGKYRLRMPFHHIDTLLQWARQINGIVFLDIQVGLSTIQEELPQLEAYLAMPEVHLGIDPEFAMKNGARPGTAIGSLDAADINYATHYLAELVKKYHIPPKMLVVHRFTQRMLTNYQQIKLVPQVQIVIDMDGWNIPAIKANTYRQYVYKEPVQFTGFKIFYKNDVVKVNQRREMQPEEVLKLIPKPVYIQYQ